MDLSSLTTLKSADAVNTAAVTSLGLIGGWVTARETGIRPLGGVVLAGAGVLAGRTWLRRDGVATCAGLSVLYLAAFGGSHPLAKRIGAWPSVLTVTGVVGCAAWALSDRTA